MFLAQVRDDERVTLGDVCAKLRDYEEHLQSRSGSPAGAGSVADEPRRSSSPPRAPTPALLEATDGRTKDGHVADTPAPIAPEVKGFRKGGDRPLPSPLAP